MLVLTVLFICVASGSANYTSNSFVDYTSSSFDNYTATEFANRTRTAKPYFSLVDLKKHFDKFIEEHGKIYETSTEMRNRFNIFKDNLLKANHWNELYPHENYGITEFADWTPVEFSKSFSSLSGGTQIPCQKGNTRNFINDPHFNQITFDWRYHGAVTPVKHQGTCNSCYAWSAIGNLEGQYARAYKRQINFSAQQIIDCDQYSHGCNNGWTTNAGRYLVEVGGAMTENSYPSTGKKGNCHHDRKQFVARVTGCHQFPDIDEETLKQLLVQVGPLSVAIDSRNWHMYTGGIHFNCGKDINHAVLLVGYGEENGIPYWTIKNTAGTRWGEDGYIRIPRGRNACGILNKQIVTVTVAPPNGIY